MRIRTYVHSKTELLFYIHIPTCLSVTMQTVRVNSAENSAVRNTVSMVNGKVDV